jgi:hypothetical protein
MDPPIDIVSGLLGAMWACLAAAALAYALRPITSGRNSVVLVTVVASLAFAAGYFAHRSPAARGATVPASGTYDSALVDRLPVENAPALGWIDRVTERPGSVNVDGWAADTVRYMPGAGVFVIVDGTARIGGSPATYGIDRPDVARTFNDADLLWTGYAIRFIPIGLASGRHSAQVAVISSDLKHAYVVAKRFEFTVP